MYKTTSVLTLLLIVLATKLVALDASFHQVEAHKGESALELLQRYDLDKYTCNLEQFSQLNNLKISDFLKENERYFLPVLLYPYNGQSIQSTLGLNDWESAHRIKEYNERMLEKKLRLQSVVDSRILWVPYHELHCADKFADPAYYSIETTPKHIETNVKGTRTFPIFGSKYENVPLESNRLKGKVFYIVSGHGGPDPGAIGKRGNNTLCEDEYAYDVCLRLSRNLLAHGAIAYMIIRDPDDGIRDEQYLKPDQDEYCWGGYKLPQSQKNRLFQRSATVNQLFEKNKKAGYDQQFLITVHLDSRQKGERIDVFFYHNPESEEGKSCAEKIQQSLSKKYAQYRKTGQYKGSVSSRNLHMLREIQPTSIFIELGNILNKKDQERFIFPSNRQYLADWIFEGILDF